MLSKDNSQRLQKVEPKKPKYSIRKFSVGAASVLIGLTFTGMLEKPTTVKANSVNNTEESLSTKTDVQNTVGGEKRLLINN